MLFALPWLNHQPAFYHWGHLPVMLMDYIGALKTWLYWPIFSTWAPSVWSVRLPVCIISVITVWLFADLVKRVAGETAAVCATALLATDAPFILTNTFDWGPVCLLLLSTVASLNLLTRYAVSRNRLQLVGAFLIVGLATWYKAFFVVLFVAMACSWLIVYGAKQIGILKIGIPIFLLGAMPLIVFNIQRPFATAKASSYLPSVAPDEKLLMMRRTFEGRSLENYMFSSAPHERIQLSGASPGDLAKSWFRDSIAAGAAVFAGFAVF
jgi:4-amino-4-deoxy-L-arabinose transferase-like glycosyltransferase